jgi:hypothetical protein
MIGRRYAQRSEGPKEIKTEEESYCNKLQSFSISYWEH